MQSSFLLNVSFVLFRFVLFSLVVVFLYYFVVVVVIIIFSVFLCCFVSLLFSECSWSVCMNVKYVCLASAFVMCSYVCMHVYVCM